MGEAQSPHNSKAMRPEWVLAISSLLRHPGKTQTVSRSWRLSRLSPGARQDPPPATPPSNQSQLSAEQFRIARAGFVFLVYWSPKPVTRVVFSFPLFWEGKEQHQLLIQSTYSVFSTSCCFSPTLTTVLPGRYYYLH